MKIHKFRVELELDFSSNQSPAKLAPELQSALENAVDTQDFLHKLRQVDAAFDDTTEVKVLKVEPVA